MFYSSPTEMWYLKHSYVISDYKWHLRAVSKLGNAQSGRKVESVISYKNGLEMPSFIGPSTIYYSSFCKSNLLFFF